MEKRADLHVHTRLSDSTFTPAEVIQCAKEKGICAVAITDHDCVEGIGPSISAAKGLDLEVIPGVELTSETKDCEVHILGFFLDWKAEWFLQRLKHICEDRIVRMEKMVKCLNRLGIEVEMEEVIREGGSGSVGRLHLAQVLYKNHQISSLREAFQRFIGSHKPCYIKGHRISPFEAIEMICKVGGIPVLGHPHVMGRDEFIPSFIKAGLQGIEVYHTDHSDNVTRHYLKLAQEYGLLVTGGSDCHGLGKGQVLMGKVTVPYELVEKLKEVKHRPITLRSAGFSEK